MDKKQAQMKQEIAMMMAKKDYYDVLGTPKNANQAEIKKAYKKLALRFHPDKNSTEGSKQVFKKVSNAYTVLINPEQKDRYDRYGPQQQIQARQRQQHRTNYGQHTGDQQFDDFDDIFRAFFGMNGMQQMNRNGPRFRTYTYNMGGGAAAQPQGQRNQGGGFHYLFILIFLFYAISPLFKSAPYHSLSVNSDYRFKVNTDVLHTPYYAREGFFQQAKKDANFKKKIDEEVDLYYLTTLKKNCEQSNRLKTKLQYQASQSRGQYRNYYMNQAKKVDLSACKSLDNLYKNSQDYVQYLFYYR